MGVLSTFFLAYPAKSSSIENHSGTDQHLYYEIHKNIVVSRVNENSLGTFLYLFVLNTELLFSHDFTLLETNCQYKSKFCPRSLVTNSVFLCLVHSGVCIGLVLFIVRRPNENNTWGLLDQHPKRLSSSHIILSSKPIYHILMWKQQWIKKEIQLLSVIGCYTSQIFFKKL